ncbi:RidA family protein [Sphingomonas qomolangmaensis]|uniref:Transposase n=1 Tax=Sphingomonas qomolangmaensis TaxID=2918765 RepID=A0ABY5L8W5_9SPHN|nr:hypothetical protein [Sphingomonas qomolangmaensis]UUL82508.1 hypothetical protein NMP03_15270 [Sphingomonas qomolangmaensis]
MSDFAAMNRACERWLDGLPKPAHATGEAKLARAGNLVEIAVVAAAGGKQSC